MALQGAQSWGDDGGFRRASELSEAHLPHDLTAEFQTSLLVEKGKSGRGTESGDMEKKYNSNTRPNGTA